MKPAPPLLVIAEGRRTRSRKALADRPREMALHLAVVEVLANLGDPAWRWTHFPAGEHRDVRTAAKLKRMGTKPGWPDFLLVSPAGGFHGLEIKREGEGLSDAQAAFQLWAIRNGTPYAVASSLDEALAVLSAWRCIHRLSANRNPPEVRRSRHEHPKNCT